MLHDSFQLSKSLAMIIRSGIAKVTRYDSEIAIGFA